MTEDKTETARPLPHKGAPVLFLLAFALASYFAVRAPDYSAIPAPRPGAPAPANPVPGAGGPVLSLLPAVGKPLPGDMTGQAAVALNVARQWRPDAMLVQIDVQQSASYLPVFSFISPADNTRLNVMGRDKAMTTSEMPAASDPAAPSQPIILRFIDLPDAVNFARMRGMTGEVRRAGLRVAPGAPSGDQALVWTIQPDADRPPYAINAVTGLPAGRP
jgi:hypothetical protein